MPTEVDVQARVIAGDDERPAGEEKEAEGARAAPARRAHGGAWGVRPGARLERWIESLNRELGHVQ